MNKFLVRFLIYSSVALTVTMGLFLGSYLFIWGQTSVAQEVESSFSGSRINGRLDSDSDTLEEDGSYFNLETFEGKAGQQLTIDLMSEEFDAYLMLLDYEGNTIAEDNDNGIEQNAKLIVTLPETGTYIMLVTSNQAGELGEYILSWGETTTKDLALLKAEELNQQVIELHQQGKYDEAIPLAEEALAIAQKQLVDNHLSTATYLNNLALLYQDQGRFSEAETLFKQALAITQKQLGDNHLDTALSFNNLAGMYEELGRYAEAERLFQQALAIKQEQLGENHLSTATSLNNLAVLYESQGRYAEAETLYEQALAIRREQLGDNHSDTAASLNNLAGLYESQGRYSEAEPLYQEALAIFREQLGENHPSTANSLNNLAGLYESQGRYAEAETLYEQALTIFQKQLGENHLSTATSLNNLAFLYRAQGRYSEAEPLYQKALAIFQKQLGENHPSTATSLNNLAELYESQGRYPEAEPLYQQALAIRREQLGNHHPDTAASLSNLALLYHIQGRYTDAEPLYQQALSIRREQLGDNHLDTVLSFNNLAGLYEELGRYTEAERLFQQALAIKQEQLGENHPSTATSLNNLAGLYESQGRYSEAEPLYQQALAIRQEKLGENHPSTADSLNNLAGLYFAQGRYTEAEPLFQQALAIRREQLGNNHPSTGDSLNNLALLYNSQGRYTDAEPLYQQALAITREKLGDNHPSTALSFNNLAELYKEQGRYTEAESLLKQALDILFNLEKTLGDNHPYTAILFNNLAGLYEDQERYSEAEDLYQKALAIRREKLGDNHSDTAAFLNNLALLYHDQGRYTEAEDLYQQALAIIREKLGDNHLITGTFINNLAGLYESQGRYSEAEPLFQQALAITQKQLGDNHPDTGFSLINLASLYESQGNINQALELLTQGIQVQEYNISENLIAGSEQQKRDYIATISSTTNAVISRNIKSTFNNQDAINLALTSILQRKGRILDVLTNSLEILRQQTDDSKTQDLLTELINLRTQYSNLIFRKPEDIKSPDLHRQQLIELDTQAEQLEDQLGRSSAEFLNLSVTLEKIQQPIPENSALVELVRYQSFNPQAPRNKRWEEFRYAAYILRSQGQPQAIDLGEAEPIDRAVEQFRHNLCTTAKTAETTQYCLDNLPLAQVKSSAQKLDQMVMQPIRQLLGDTKNILLSPDGKLNLVPFEALVDENDQYLVENYNFTYLTSGRDLMRLQQKSPSKEPPLVIADPLYNEENNLVASNIPQRSLEDISELFNRNSFPRLAATAKEAKAIQSILNLPNEQIKLQNQANETSLKQVKSPQILHIATHGFFLDKPPETNSNPSPNQINNFNPPSTIDNPLFRSGLVLAGVESPSNEETEVNDGVFTAYEATFLNLSGTKLVVLSACDTGIGDITTGEGIYGLRRALVIAGSESQVISLWKVVDEGTKDLMVTYYQKLQQGEGRTNALHEVQREMLRGELTGENGQFYEHPYYWASFIPSGDWTPMELR